MCGGGDGGVCGRGLIMCVCGGGGDVCVEWVMCVWRG